MNPGFKIYCKERKKILDMVMNHMEWSMHQAIHWYTSKNPHFGGTSPYQLVVAGRAHKVIKFIEGAIDENSAPKQEGQK